MSRVTILVFNSLKTLSISNLIRIFLFLFLLISIPLTTLSVRNIRGSKSLASGWSISLSVACDYSTKTTYLYRTVTIPVGYEKGYMNFYANGKLYTQYYDTYPGHANVREGSAGSPGNSIYATLHSGSAAGPLQATSNTVTAPDCSTPPCTNQCSSGTKQCVSSNSFQTCGDYNGDGCFEWSAATACSTSQSCSGAGVCSTNSGGASGGGSSGGGTSGGGSSDGKKTSGGSSGTGLGVNILESLQTETSVPFSVGDVDIKIEVGGVAKDLKIEKNNNNYSIDVKDGNLSLNKEYSLIIIGEKTLRKKVSFTPTDSSFSVNIGDLVLGDLNQDNRIDKRDQDLLLKSIESQTLLGDLNADGVANSLDWSIILENFGKKGD